MAVKNILRLADHLPGEGGLIVDSLLQHDGSESEYHSHVENEIHFQRPTRFSGIQSGILL
jgi:hypothetical protein